MRPRCLERIAGPAAGACAALAIAVLAALPAGESAPRHGPALLAASATQGKLRIANSKRGGPILRASKLLPGRAVRGKLRLRNRGAMPVTVRLRATALRDWPGPAGAPLSRALELKVVRLARFARGRRFPRRRHRTLYRGALAGLSGVRAGRLGPGMRRRFRFRVELPDRGRPPSPAGGDNRYQGASMSVGFVWRARPAR
jgi:hypothetical protein